MIAQAGAHDDAVVAHARRRLAGNQRLSSGYGQKRGNSDRDRRGGDDRTGVESNVAQLVIERLAIHAPVSPRTSIRRLRPLSGRPA